MFSKYEYLRVSANALFYLRKEALPAIRVNFNDQRRGKPQGNWRFLWPAFFIDTKKSLSYGSSVQNIYCIDKRKSEY